MRDALPSRLAASVREGEGTGEVSSQTTATGVQRLLNRRAILRGGAVVAGGAAAAALTSPAGAQIGSAPGIPSVKDFGAVGDGVNDDTAAFNAALKAALQDRRTLLIPPSQQPYLIPNGWALGAAHGLTIMGYGATIKTTAPARPAVCTFNPALRADSYATDQTIAWYNLDTASSPYGRGTCLVKLANTSDAANLAAGDVIWIRARGLVIGAESATPVAEMNIVRAIDGATVHLVYPLAKDYDFDPAWPFAVGKATKYCRGLNVQGLTVQNVSGRAFAAHQVLDCQLRDLRIIGSSGLALRGRFIRADGIYVQITPDWASRWRPFAVAMDTGTSDVNITGLQSISTGAGIIHIHEACANIRMAGQVANGAFDDGSNEEWGALSVRALSWDVDLDLDVTNSPRGAALDSHNSGPYPTEGNINLRWRGTFSGSTRANFNLVKSSGIAVSTSQVMTSS